MKSFGAVNVVIARQSLIVVSLLQYAAVFAFLSPDDFFVFGVLMIINVYCRNVFDSVLQPSALNYAPNASHSLFYKAHYLIVVIISYSIAGGDFFLLSASILVGFCQLFFNHQFCQYFSNAYATKKYYRLALCQSCADLLCIIIGFSLMFMTDNVYYLAIRFVLYPLFLLCLCGLYLDGSVTAHTNVQQPSKSIRYLNIQHFFGFLGRSGDRLLVVSLLEPGVFALYDRAMSGMRVVYSALSQPLTPYILIQFRKLRDDSEGDIVKYLSLFSLLTYVFGWIIFWFIYLLLPFFDRFIPSDWLGITDYLIGLIWLIPLNMTIFNASSFFIALHREGLNLLSGILSTCSIIFAFAAGILWGGIQTALIFLVIALAVNVGQVYTLILYNQGWRAYFRFYLIPVFHVIIFFLVS